MFRATGREVAPDLSPTTRTLGAFHADQQWPITQDPERRHNRLADRVAEHVRCGRRSMDHGPLRRAERISGL